MDRYELEHNLIPSMFYENSKTFMQTVTANGNDFFYELYSDSVELRKEYNKYEFDSGMLEYEGAKINRTFVPKPDRPGYCVMVYFVCSADYMPLSYLTVELAAGGGYVISGWTRELEQTEYGIFDGNNEKGIIDKIVERLLSGEGTGAAGGEYGEMAELLKQFNIEYYENELSDYIQMFNIIGELTENRLERSEMTAAFASLAGIVRDTNNRTSHDKISKEYKSFEEMPATKGKLEYKHKLFFAFCVYAACNIISENDDKKHHYMGIAEFESAEAIKYRMEEYWSMDPYMFDVGER